MLSFGLSIAIVEKGNDFPIKYWKIRLQKILGLIHWKLPQMLLCTTCTSFWATLISDIVLFLLNFFIMGQFYWFWPFSGFITLGITWFIIEFLNAIDR